MGDSLTKGQTLFELETGKASMEVLAPSDGVLETLSVSEGDEVSVGDRVGTLSGGNKSEDTGTEDFSEDEAEDLPMLPGDSHREECKDVSEMEEEFSECGELPLVVPALGEGVKGGSVVTLSVSAGDKVSEGQPLFELETGKAAVEVPAPAEGTLIALDIEEGSEVKVGDTVGSMAANESAANKITWKGSKKDTKTDHRQQKGTPEQISGVPLSMEHGVRGSGSRGRIQKGGVKANPNPLQESCKIPPDKKVPLPDFSTFGEMERRQMSAIRKMTVEHMDKCWSTIPHVTQFDDADVTDLEILRKNFQPKAEKVGTKLTMTAMLIKIMGSALKAFPKFNASLDLENKEIVYKKYINIGCAVDTPKGLVVPVIRGIDSLNMIEISQKLGELAGSMRDGKINPEMLQGGCMTLSNLGGLGGKHFTPIVNGPEVAILGVGRASMKPAWNGSEFEPRLMMPLSLSYDHRLIDGADGTRFLRWIVDALEHPLLISLEG